MAENLSMHIPLRSISLPSRLHPKSLKTEAELTKLKSLKLLPSSSSPSAIQIDLTRLAELFLCIQELNISPQTQQNFHPQHSNHVIEDVLDQSVGLIDICSTVRDMFLTMQEHVRDLQSALRRRGKYSSIESNVQAYISFRKNSKKVITKSLRTLKRFEVSSNKEHHSYYVTNVIREAHAIAANIFQSLLLFLSLPEMKMNASSRWSILSKLIRSGSEIRDHHKIFNEVETVDIALSCIYGQIKKNNYTKFDVQEVQGKLKGLSVSIQQLEPKLDCVFRCLIQNRVSLLNLITNL